MSSPFSRPFSLLITLLAITVTGKAQLGVDLVGKIEKTTSSCNARITHKLTCSDVFLYGASGVDLSKLEGQTVNVKGSLQLATCVLVEVAETGTFRNVMTISPSRGGSYRIGESAVFRTRAPFLALVPLFIAGDKFFVPLGPFGHIGFGLPVVWVNTKIALLGSASTTCPIPNDRGLVGVTIYSQGAYVSIGLGGIEGRLANVDCFTIQGLSASS